MSGFRDWPPRLSLLRRAGQRGCISLDREVPVVGVGVNGRAAARTFVARGHDVTLWDVDEGRAHQAAEQLGAKVAGSQDEALGTTSW